MVWVQIIGEHVTYLYYCFFFSFIFLLYLSNPLKARPLLLVALVINVTGNEFISGSCNLSINARL
jgi:hypothetical protein